MCPYRGCVVIWNKYLTILAEVLMDLHSTKKRKWTLLQLQLYHILTQSMVSIIYHMNEKFILYKTNCKL